MSPGQEFEWGSEAENSGSAVKAQSFITVVSGALHFFLL